MTENKDSNKAQGADLLTPPKAETPQAPPQTQLQGEGETKPPPAQVTAAKKVGIEALQSNKQGDVQKFLMQFTPALSQLMPAHLLDYGKRQLGIAAHKIASTNSIRACDPASIAQVVMRVAMSGLDLGLDHVYLVPYGSQLQYQIGYKGYLQMAYNSGKVSKVVAYAVYDKEVFSFKIVDGEEKLHHEPNHDLYNTEVVKAYAVATMKDGSKQYVILGRKQIEALRLRNASQKNRISGAWDTDYPEMAKAKAVKQLCKLLPLSMDDRALIENDEVEVPTFTDYEVVV